MGFVFIFTFGKPIPIIDFIYFGFYYVLQTITIIHNISRSLGYCYAIGFEIYRNTSRTIDMFYGYCYLTRIGALSYYIDTDSFQTGCLLMCAGHKFAPPHFLKVANYLTLNNYPYIYISAKVLIII